MAPSDEKLLEANVTCFSGGSLKDKSEILMLGMHFDISSILILTIVISESRGGKIKIVLVCDSCRFIPTLSFEMYK